MFAELSFKVEATEKASDEPTISIDDNVRKALSSEELASLRDSLVSALARGARGFPVVGIAVRVVDVRRDGDTSSGALRACASTFIDQLLGRGRKTSVGSGDHSHGIVLEPIMTVEVESPEKYLGSILNDLTGVRRGQVERVDSRVQWSAVTASVPLYTLLGYATSLRSMTQGEGTFSMEYLTHQPVDDATVAGMLGSSS